MADLPTGVVPPQASPAPAVPSNVIGGSPAGASTPAAVLASAQNLNRPSSAAPAPQAGGMVPLAALQEERERRQSLQADLESLKAQVGKLSQQQPQQYNQPVQPMVDHQAELTKLWETDPRRAVQQEIMMAAQWQDNIHAQVDGEAEALAQRYPDFNNFRGEAMRYVRSLPLDQRARPGIVEMAYMLSRGQGVDRIIEQQRQQLQQQFQQNPAMFQMPTGAGVTPPPSQQQGGLTDEQIRVANAMGLTPEKYASGIRK